MFDADAERNLLFGLIALHAGLIDQRQLVAAFGAWSRAKAVALAARLAARGDLDAEQRAGVELEGATTDGTSDDRGSKREKRAGCVRETDRSPTHLARPFGPSRVMLAVPSARSVPEGSAQSHLAGWYEKHGPEDCCRNAGRLGRFDSTSRVERLGQFHLSTFVGPLDRDWRVCHFFRC